MTRAEMIIRGITQMLLDEGVFPSPKAILDRMVQVGHPARHSRDLSGLESKMRAKVLTDNGYRKGPNGRWSKPE